MAERPPLDLSGILGDYEVFGGSPRRGPPAIEAGKAWYEQAPGAIEAEEVRRRTQEARDNNPQLQGFGPLTASTCMALALSPTWCWDVLGYYRTMGVHWRATKKELMVAYQSFGSMPSAYQTHVFKQLLDPKKRRAYDMTPLGQLFLDDHYIQQMLKNRAAQEAARRSQGGRPTTAKEVIEEEFHFVPEEDETSVDAIESGGADSGPSGFAPWPFAYFTWRSNKDETDVLAQWQDLVIQAVAAEGEVLSIAVGFVGKQPHRYLVGRVGKTQVAFINEKECPTPALASAAALALIHDMNTS